MTHPSASRLFNRAANLILIVLFLLGGMTVPTHAQASVPRFEQGPCNLDLTTSYVEGKDLQCGWLIVPQEYEKPGEGEIRLEVAIIKSQAAHPASDPLFMLQGGPGGSTIYTYLQLIPLDPQLSKLDRDIVLFDQRGTMYSQPSLFCQEVYDLGIKLLDEDISRDEANSQYVQALDACHTRLVKEGVNLSAYDSLENAHDVESLRLALGYDKINLYGVSYGSLLALHVLHNYPQGLRSVIIDGVVPPQVNFLTTAPNTVNRSLELIFSSCAQDADCNKAYPDLKKVFYDQVDYLNQHKQPITLIDFQGGKSYPALLDGDTLIAMVTQMLYQTDILPMMPRVIYDVRAGRYDFAEKLLSMIAFDKSINYGMYYSVLCAEDADFKPQDVDLSQLPEQMRVTQENDAEEFLQTCKDWQVNALPPSVDDPVSSDLPVLLLSGMFDPVTPPSFAETAAQTLSNSYSFVFPAGGHGALTSGECQDDIFLQFLNDPTQKPDGSCINDQKMTFATPGALVPVPVLIDLLSLRGAVAWELGLYALALFFLLSALLVYPIVWFVRLIRGSGKPAAAPQTAYEIEGQESTPIPAPPSTQPVKRPLFYRLAPWAAALAGLSLLAFVIALFATGMQMALSNDSRLYIGLPGAARPLFVLPLLALLAGLVMLFGAAAAWARRGGSVWGRLYLTLLTLAEVVCLIVLALWQVLFAVFAG